MANARKGSILATAISLLAVFLTMAVGTMTYMESSMNRSRTDRYRGLADQAARSGLDFVLGWAQANIDATSHLPRDWAAMQDNDVINPVFLFADNAPNVNVIPGFAAYNQASFNAGNRIIGSNPAIDGEFVLSVNDQLVTTFKARVQQYRISDSMPRQFRIAVVGRVRLLNPGSEPGSISTNEKQSIVSERLLMTNVGEDPLSRYAALIDIDPIKNWVPGEVVDGPVHINRGYVDSEVDIDGSGKDFREVGLAIGGGANFTDAGVSLPSSNVRSVMNIRTTAGGMFTAVGTATAPQFTDTVSMTAIPAGAPTSGKYKNADASDYSTALLYDGNPYAASTTDTVARTIFQGSDNVLPDPKLGRVGPQILDQPIALPRSVRNRLGSVLGVPQNTSLYDYRTWWGALPDGIYVPWTSAGGPSASFFEPASPSTGPSGKTIPADARVLGGVYIRGNVELMRMGVGGPANKFSVYLFQLGYGSAGAANHRCYAYIVDRTSKESFLLAWLPNDTTASGFGSGSGGDFDTSALLAALPGVPPGFTANPAAGAFGLTTGAGQPFAHFLAPANARDFPFNGTIFVDISQADPARDTTNPNLFLAGKTPITGNIFALGDPGRPFSTDPWLRYNVGGGPRLLNGQPEERVATYDGVTPTNGASKLTIMAVGNIFIQNHIVLQSISSGAAFPDPALFGNPGGPPPLTSPDSSIVTINTTRDLLGIVADKQVVLGLCAPSVASNAQRAKVGTEIHAAIAALGDPAFNYTTGTNDPNEMQGTAAYRGSFATEGLMQYYNIAEQYNVCDAVPTPTATPYTVLPATALQYPGTPLYTNVYNFPAGTMAFLNNPNGNITRGKAVVFGSVTVKKRGILGKGDTSFDKRFVFDRRLLSISPPIFPTSTNLVVRTQQPGDLSGMAYWGGPGGTPAMQWLK